MIKKFLYLLSILTILPAFSGDYEKSISNDENVLLYLYTNNCNYCVKFDPIFDKLQEKFSNNCKFLKVDITSTYGTELMHKFNAYYVPYVILYNNNKRIMHTIVPTCLINYACAKDAIEKFIN